MTDKFDGQYVETLTGGSEVDRLRTIIREMDEKWWVIAKQRNALTAENNQLRGWMREVAGELLDLVEADDAGIAKPQNLRELAGKLLRTPSK